MRSMAARVVWSFAIEVWYWWWPLILLDFADILFFWLLIGYEVKEGEHIHD